MFSSGKDPQTSSHSSISQNNSNSTSTELSSSSFHMHQRHNGKKSEHNYDNHPNYNPGYLESGNNPNMRGGRGNDMNSNILEQQNNDRIDELSGQVAHLKRLTIDIGNEVGDQNRFLDGMGDGFSNTRDLLAGSLLQIGTMLQNGGTKHMCYMVSFVVFIMVFLYWIISYRG